jgi:uncharacterized protein
MSLNTFFRAFTPKSKIFYDYFEKMADEVDLMGANLEALVKQGDVAKQAEIVSQIEHQEHICDGITHDLFTELGRNFITPFDREDVHYLATALDDVADYIYSSAKKIYKYRIDLNDEGVQKLSTFIHTGTGVIKQAIYAIRDMKKMKNVTDALIKINEIENLADDVFDDSIDKLFEIETDIKQLIKRRELYKTMEEATDKIEDVGNVIESIAVKYA